MNPAGESLPAPLDAMNLGEFEPAAWVSGMHPAAPREVIGLDELAHMDVVHGPRRVSAGTYDAWLAVLRTRNPRFEFLDPPFRQSLPMTLAFAATGSRSAAVLTGPCHRVGAGSEPDRTAGTGTYDMVPVRVEQRRLAATAGLVWSGDLPASSSSCFSTPPTASLLTHANRTGQYHESHPRFYHREIAGWTGR